MFTDTSLYWLLQLMSCVISCFMSRTSYETGYENNLGFAAETCSAFVNLKFQLEVGPLSSKPHCGFDIMEFLVGLHRGWYAILFQI